MAPTKKEPSAERYFKLLEFIDTIVKYDRTTLLELQYALCTIEKMQTAPVKPSTRRTSQPLELAHLDISRKVEPSISKAIRGVPEKLTKSKLIHKT